MLPGFMAARPGVEVELNVSNRNVDFVEDGYDLAIRLGERSDSRQVSRTLGEASAGIFGSPTYLRHRAAPTMLDELKQHELIQFVLPGTGRPMPWILRTPDGVDMEFNFKSRQRVHEDVLAGLGWAAAGGGLFQIYHFLSRAKLCKLGVWLRQCRATTAVLGPSMCSTPRTGIFQRGCAHSCSIWPAPSVELALLLRSAARR